MKIDCSLTENYLKEYSRMTNCCEMECKECSLSSFRNSNELGCAEFTKKNTKEVIKIVQAWSDDNPQKTYLEDFKEKYPNAKINVNRDIPHVCLNNLKSNINCLNPIDCFICWNQIMEEN